MEATRWPSMGRDVFRRGDKVASFCFCCGRGHTPGSAHRDDSLVRTRALFFFSVPVSLVDVVLVGDLCPFIHYRRV